MAKKKRTSKASGYVSFNKEDVQNEINNDGQNREALGLLLEAMDVSKHVQKKVKKGKEYAISDDDIYPTTLEETQRMESLLNQAEKAADNPSDREFFAQLSEMRDIVAWSKKRHWNFSWVIAICVFLVTLFFGSRAKDWDEKAGRQENYVKGIENWQDSSVNAYRNKKIDNLEQRMTIDDKNITYYQSVIDTSSSKQAVKDAKKSLERVEKDKKERQAELAGWKKADNEEIKEQADKEGTKILKHFKKEKRFWRFWQWFFLLLIPLYIFAERPYGYSMSRYRTEAQVLGGIKKAAFAISGGLLGIAGSIKFTEVVTKWSDGSTTREDDGTGALKIGIIALLVIAALIVIAVMACALMLYSTIAGLIRNYDWKSMVAASKK